MRSFFHLLAATILALATCSSLWGPSALAATLNVTVSPVTGGSVNSWPTGISCPSNCTATYAVGTSVSLTAEFSAGYQFDHWEGDVTGTDHYQSVTMDTDKNVKAVFVPVRNPQTLTVRILPNGGGSVSSWPSGISCPSDCTEPYPQNASISLTADFATGYQFDHWEGDLTGTEASQTIIMSTAKTVTAVFVPVTNPQTLNVAVSPVGGGSVSSWPSGISCPTDCTEAYPLNTQVGLTADFATGYQFDHWEGDLTGSSTSPTITMNGPKRVTAVFVPLASPQTLTVTVSPAGGGSVGSWPSGISCPTDCAEDYPLNTQVGLTANFTAGYQFDHWEGDLTGGNSQQTITMNSPKRVTAVFVPVTAPQTLEVTVTPVAGGIVRSNPNGIYCPGNCSATFPLNTQVGLTAEFATGYQFDHWEGDLTGTGSTQTVTMSGPKRVTAVFVPVTNPQTLTVTVSPLGGGSVRSNPTGIACPGTCSATYPLNTSVGLTAEFATGYQFDHWEGDLTGTNPAQSVNMTGPKNVTAVFVPVTNPQTLNVTVSPLGGGTVRSDPSGIACPGNCTATYPLNTQVALTADFLPGYQFDHWEGGLTGNSPSQSITMNGPKSATAVFVRVQNPQTLNVTVSPSGAGNVRSNPAGISCPSNCTAVYPFNTPVGLTAEFNTGFQFDHWEGDLTGTNPSRTVNMNGPKNVTAVFIPVVNPQTLTVTVSPDGGGTVRSTPVGISCPANCVTNYPLNTSVGLTASFSSGFQFDHWEGDLTGTSSSQNVTMTGSKNVTAVFVPARNPQTLKVTVSPQGGGTIRSDPAGIACPDTCSASFPWGTQVSVTAIYNSGYKFDHWEGDLSGTGNRNTLTMSGPKQATAVFVPAKTFSLTIPPGTQAGDYRLVSWPLQPASSQLSDLLDPQIGSYDPSTMRIGHWDPLLQSYVEYPGGSPVQAGWTGWFLFRYGINLVFTGTTVQTVVGPKGLYGYYYPLFPGWNQVGNPFPFQVGTNSMWVTDDNTKTFKQLLDSGNDITQPGLWIYNAGQYAPAQALKAAEGAWLKKLAPGPGAIFYEGVEFTGTASSMNSADLKDMEHPPAPPAGAEAGSSPTASGGSGGAGGCFIATSGGF